MRKVNFTARCRDVYLLRFHCAKSRNFAVHVWSGRSWTAHSQCLLDSIEKGDVTLAGMIWVSLLSIVPSGLLRCHGMFKDIGCTPQECWDVDGYVHPRVMSWVIAQFITRNSNLFHIMSITQFGYANENIFRSIFLDMANQLATMGCPKDMPKKITSSCYQSEYFYLKFKTLNLCSVSSVRSGAPWQRGYPESGPRNECSAGGVCSGTESSTQFPRGSQIGRYSDWNVVQRGKRKTTTNRRSDHTDTGRDVHVYLFYWLCQC